MPPPVVVEPHRTAGQKRDGPYSAPTYRTRLPRSLSPHLPSSGHRPKLVFNGVEIARFCIGGQLSRLCFKFVSGLHKIILVF